MKEFRKLPEPIQKQVLLRFIFAIPLLILFMAFSLILRDVYLSVPFAISSVFCMFSALRLYDRAKRGEYLMLSGICRSVQKTAIRRRVKSLVLDTDNHIVDVAVKNRLLRAEPGVRVTMYIDRKTSVYEKDGAQKLYEYIAMSVDYGAVNS